MIFSLHKIFLKLLFIPNLKLTNSNYKIEGIKAMAHEILA